MHINRALRDAGLLRGPRGGRGRDARPGRLARLRGAPTTRSRTSTSPTRPIGAGAAASAGPRRASRRCSTRPASAAHGLDHPRSGELVAVAAPNAWFTYYYWLDDARAPDFARTVEIHRKPGYDPVELFLDPAIRHPKLAIGARLAKRALGFRALMDVIPLDAALVKGSHGRVTARPEDGPLVIGSDAALLPDGPIAATAVKGLILDHVFGASAAGGAIG